MFHTRQPPTPWSHAFPMPTPNRLRLLIPSNHPHENPAHCCADPNQTPAQNAVHPKSKKTIVAPDRDSLSDLESFVSFDQAVAGFCYRHPVRHIMQGLVKGRDHTALIRVAPQTDDFAGHGII